MSRFFKRAASALTLAVLVAVLLLPALAVSARGAVLVGPKENYLALGDSLAYGYQPDLDFDDGYVADFGKDLLTRGGKHTANLGCPGETSKSLVNAGCTGFFLRRYPYIGAQLNAALLYLALHRGHVSPVTLDIGGNDILPDFNATTCAINTSKFATDLATLDANLQAVILPKLHAALLVDGVVTGDLALSNYYDPYQNSCPATLPYVQTLNQHLAADVRGYGTIVDVFSAFGGSSTPNPNLCSYTWICSFYHDIHASVAGYSVMASIFEGTLGY